MAKVPLEDEEAFFLADWLTMKGIKFAHIANERKTHISNAVKLKKMGVSKGFPDYIVIVPSDGTFYTIFIELKRQRITKKNGTVGRSPSAVSEEQIAWVNVLNTCEQTEAHICYGSQEAIDIITKLID